MPGGATDIQAALYNGLTDISASSTYKYGKNSIFIFTDGMATCPHDTVADSDGSFDIPYTAFPSSPVDDGRQHKCDFYGSNVYVSINKIIVHSCSAICR